MKRPSMTEAQLAAHVVSWLKSEDFDVYEEVEWAVGRADIFATRGDELVAVECKKQLSFDVMAQAKRWLPHVTASYVAVEAAQSSRGRWLAFEVVEVLGLRVLEVTSLWPVEVGRVCPITLRGGDYTTIRHVNPDLVDALRPEHKTRARAGTNAGGHHTRFRQTVEALAVYAEANPGCLLRTALSMVDHHYRSIGGAIGSLMDTKRIETAKLAALGVRFERGDDGLPRLYPTERSASHLTLYRQ